VAIAGGSFAVKNYVDKANAAEARARALQAEKEEVEAETHKLRFELENTKDPQKIAELTAALSAAQAKAAALATENPAAARPQHQGGATAGPARPAQPGPKPACNCTPGDPLCSCL
jgi:colicin import membrane protein